MGRMPRPCNAVDTSRTGRYPLSIKLVGVRNTRRVADGLLLSLGLLLLLALPARIVCAADSSGGYARRLSMALSAVRTAERASGAARARDLSVARGLLPARLRARVGCDIVSVDLGLVRRDLVAGRLRTVDARLVGMRAALDTPAARPAAPDARRLGDLDKVLRAPPFTSSDLWTTLGRLVLGSPLGMVLGAVGRVLDGFFGAVGAARRPVVLLVEVVAGVVVAAALVFAATRLLTPFVPRATSGEDPFDVDVARIRVDAAGARTRAPALAAAGAYREAARYVFLATLLALDEAGRLRIDEATGNSDVLRQARATPHLAEALTPVVRLFELFWFGHAPVTREEYERYQRLSERALEAAR